MGEPGGSLVTGCFEDNATSSVGVFPGPSTSSCRGRHPTSNIVNLQTLQGDIFYLSPVRKCIFRDGEFYCLPS